jgi:hypothetical protein
VECRNGGSDKWVQVNWPAEAEVIEAALAIRPEAHTRGWKPGEPVANLLAENAKHGVGL